jgi:hypothetical protein
MLQGTFRGSPDRVLLDFHTALVSGKKLGLKAFAIQGGLPGLVAKAKKTGGKRESQSGERATQVAARGALRTAGGVVSALSGSGIGGQLVGNLGQEGVSELGRDVQGGGYAMEQTILEIPAGTTFDLVTAG